MHKCTKLISWYYLQFKWERPLLLLLLLLLLARPWPDFENLLFVWEWHPPHICIHSLRPCWGSDLQPNKEGLCLKMVGCPWSHLLCQGREYNSRMRGYSCWYPMVCWDKNTVVKIERFARDKQLHPLAQIVFYFLFFFLCLVSCQNLWRCCSPFRLSVGIWGTIRPVMACLSFRQTGRANQTAEGFEVFNCSVLLEAGV